MAPAGARFWVLDIGSILQIRRILERSVSG
jgi:hypothetical protein